MSCRSSAATRRSQLAALITLPAALLAHPWPVANDWRDLKALKEELGELNAELASMDAAAREEDRPLNDDEMARVDELTGTEDRQGLIPKLEARIATAEKIEAAKNAFREGSQPTGDRPPATGGDDDPNVDPSAIGDRLARVHVPASNKVHGRLTAFSNDIQGEKEAYITGRWYAAQFFGHTESRDWLEEHGLAHASLSEGDQSAGGALVPVETSAAIIRLVEDYGVLRRSISVEPMGSDRKVVPVRVAGVTAYPVAETNTANEGSNTGTKSQPQYKNIELVARKWKAWCKFSDELNEDAFVQMGDQLTVEIALAFAYAEDNAGFNGDGTSTYHGITGVLNAVKAGSIHTALAGNTAFSTLDLVDFETLIGKLPDYPGIMPEWYISKEGYYASMHRLLMAAGGNTAANIEMGGRKTFLSYPVNFTNVLNKTLTAQTSTKLLVFGDLRMGAKLGDRRMIRISLTDQRFWDEDQIGLKGTERFDIVIHSVGTATEAGAVMVLDTPGA